jgi:sortase (surface protein transpeptidase)
MPVTTPVLRPLDPGAGPPAPGPAAGGGVPPVRIRIPGIGIDSTLARLGLNADGTVEVPPDFRQAGWYTKGPSPGDLGPAVILGHLDSATGPAVFARLSSLRSGDQVLITREDGSQLRFVVDRVLSVSVDAFPTDQVYGVTPDPALRLITCGGTYSLARGRYLSNVVAFAHLA